jgi:hypothetical protein
MLPPHAARTLVGKTLRQAPLAGSIHPSLRPAILNLPTVARYPPGPVAAVEDGCRLVAAEIDPGRGGNGQAIGLA